LQPYIHYNIPVKIANEPINPFFYFSIQLNYNLYFDKGKLKKLYGMLGDISK
jgi:hypothetical protein